MTAPPAPAEAPPRHRGGRNLPVAVAVGLGLAALALVPLYADTAVFVGVVVAFAVVGVAEVARTFSAAGRPVPAVPLVAGCPLVIILAYARGSTGLAEGLLLALLLPAAWSLVRAATGTGWAPGTALASGSATVLAAVYVPFLAGFVALLAAEPSGSARVTCYLAVVVCSDVGGYAVGVIAGRHRLAPTVSPNKTWEGLAGSVVSSLLGGTLLVWLVLSAAPWKGLVLGLAAALAATAGDLGASALKRSLGVKDFGALLPGHGGAMDRFDSMLATAPVAWLLLSALVPVR